MRLSEEVKTALADLSAADSEAQSNLSVGKPTVLKAMDAASRLASSARNLAGLSGPKRDRLWRFLENPYMRLAIDNGPFSVDPPDSNRGEARTQLITPNGGRFDAAGYIRRLNHEWRDILDAG